MEAFVLPLLQCLVVEYVILGCDVKARRTVREVTAQEAGGIGICREGRHGYPFDILSRRLGYILNLWEMAFGFGWLAGLYARC
jgi:hypothetical protein